MWRIWLCSIPEGELASWPASGRDESAFESENKCLNEDGGLLIVLVFFQRAAPSFDEASS